MVEKRKAKTELDEVIRKPSSNLNLWIEVTQSDLLPLRLTTKSDLDQVQRKHVSRDWVSGQNPKQMLQLKVKEIFRTKVKVESVKKLLHSSVRKDSDDLIKILKF